MKVMSCNIQLNDVVNVNADDVAFWVGQFAEHAAFIAALLNAEAAPRLSEEARHYAMKFREEAARGVEYDSNLLLKYFAFLVLLKSKLHKIPQVVTDIKDKHFCHLVKHYLMELTYFIRLANGKLQVWEDIEFWIYEAIDHILLFASLMGDEYPERKLLRKFAKRLKAAWKLGKQHPFILKALVKELMMHGEFIGRVRDLARSAAIRLDANMVLHEMRETDRGIERIKFYLQNIYPLGAEHKHKTEVIAMAKEEVVVIERQ